MGTQVRLFGYVLQAIMETSLDSRIVIGLFRLTDEQTNDQLTSISNVAISTTEATDDASSQDDWMLDYSADLTEDWATIAEIVEDWGFNLASGSEFLAYITGTLDGYLQFEDQYAELDLVLEEGKTRFYSCDNAGIYMLIELVADRVSDYFHLKHLELNGGLAGRL